ncbi:MAG TPA: DnaJ domain-containing protein [Deltaproteobacteria bacterium]|nr:DnaJ domain-containing protein [Deltaproteobacteria bacterium]HIJ35749.1 DnaJ domain-containing protein [Deltaproteobacteria bacterium]HIJ40280.1 DnaJ domain-containing protein [Deltaproteobacteria bacterium]
MVSSRKSKSHASLTLINKTNQKDLDPEDVKPSRRIRPRLSRTEASSLKVLKLSRSDLSSDASNERIKSAYKKMAKIHHPDVGGDEESFKQLQNAHEQMLHWAENPQYTFRKALEGCWFYDGYTGRWSPPL